jgi:TorA maturation chaperone TorD
MDVDLLPTASGEALCRSAVYAALALGLDRPGEALHSHLASSLGALALEGLLLELGIEGAPIREALRTLARGGPGESEHDRIFGPGVRWAVPPFETSYGTDRPPKQPPGPGDIAGFLKAFGLELEPRRRLRLDHVCCECELMAFLTRKEARALEEGDTELLQQARAAQRQFLEAHLGRFATVLGNRLRRADPEGYYGAIGELLLAFVASECERLRVGPAPGVPAPAPGPPGDAVPLLA